MWEVEQVNASSRLFFLNQCDTRTQFPIKILSKFVVWTFFAFASPLDLLESPHWLTNENAIYNCPLLVFKLTISIYEILDLGLFKSEINWEDKTPKQPPELALLLDLTARKKLLWEQNSDQNEVPDLLNSWCRSKTSFLMKISMLMSMKPNCRPNSLPCIFS